MLFLIAVECRYLAFYLSADDDDLCTFLFSNGTHCAHILVFPADRILINIADVYDRLHGDQMKIIQCLHLILISYDGTGSPAIAQSLPETLEHRNHEGIFLLLFLVHP